MRPDPIARLIEARAARESAGLLRVLRTVESREGPWLTVGGRRLLGFASNDYLGLAGHPALSRALADCAAREGVGATAAHLLGGHHREHARLEHALADWLERPRALLFSTGYMANLGIVGALLSEGDVCVEDKLNHASLIDAARVAGAELKRYPHADADAAARQLATRPDAAALVATDGVFSMDGDVAPLRALATLAREAGAPLVVDDAHGIGVLGPEGRGSVAAAGLGIADVPLLMGTLGKALGGFGAFVAGEDDVVDALVQFARTYVFTTALPPALAAALTAAIGVARFERWRADKLGQLVAHLRRGAALRGLLLAASTTPIQPVLLGSANTAVAVSKALEEEGFYVPAIRPPTVPDGAARLRITLCALHEEADVERLLDALARALDRREPAQPRTRPQRPSSHVHRSGR